MGKSPYTESFRKDAVRKFLSRGDRSAADLAKELGVSTVALYDWVKTMSQTTKMSTTAGADRFDVLLTFSALPENRQGEFLRTQGLTTDQLASWKTDIKLKLSEKKDGSSRGEIAQARTRVKALEKELRRKDKALAETTALLVLSKKLEVLWGQNKSDEE